MALKCLRVRRITLIHYSLPKLTELMLADFIYVIHQSSEPNPFNLRRLESRHASERSSSHGSTLIDSWSKTFRDMKKTLERISNSTLKQNSMPKTVTWWTDGLSQHLKTWLNTLDVKWTNINYTWLLDLFYHSLRNWVIGTLDLTDQEWRVKMELKNKKEVLIFFSTSSLTQPLLCLVSLHFWLTICTKTWKTVLTQTMRSFMLIQFITCKFLISLRVWLMKQLREE